MLVYYPFSGEDLVQVFIPAILSVSHCVIGEPLHHTDAPTRPTFLYESKLEFLSVSRPIPLVSWVSLHRCTSLFRHTFAQSCWCAIRHRVLFFTCVSRWLR